MWPFTKSEEVKPLGEDLPNDLKDFLIQKNNETTQSSSSEPYKFEASRNLNRVKEILTKQPIRNQEDQYQFEKFKLSNQLQNSVAINCSELEYNLNLCFQNYSIIKDMFKYPCFNKQQDLKRCKNLQTDGFKLLHYQDCYNIQQCNAIKQFLDEMFVKNFGELGENTNDNEKVNQFYNDLNKGFDKIWR
ncbi:uncharacterized protein KGF55_001410 [Candida pseudojiufengensis]|uniref:uncharacterized protein n=1 Tax=Candida pseudojiufengensis TaxID=497109 RepID=UPI002225AB72|nr:uncharacterized protein KGF55_001410 [Candida pseudojiufengensis]KAI5965190.1 hypothetical protein KGF55_001410 [Candida pseudojiufengensis]